MNAELAVGVCVCVCVCVWISCDGFVFTLHPSQLKPGGESTLVWYLVIVTSSCTFKSFWLRSS